MTGPEPQQLFGVLDATWPAARFISHGPWCLREGLGGGQRVSSATAISPLLETDIDLAETGMSDLGQRPLFMIRPGESDLDRWLGDRGYEIVDPVTIYLSRADDLAASLPPATTFPAWPPLAVQRELWSQGGIGAARIAVMERAETPKTVILARGGDTPAGVAYVGIKDEVAMLHAVEVAADHRRVGIGAAILQSTANWAIAQGARWVALAVTKANLPANALYAKFAMSPVTEYHYRRGPEGPE